jgi:alcohol dehydrogenase class IV
VRRAGLEQRLLVTTRRAAASATGLPPSTVCSHVPVETVRAAALCGASADGLVGLSGGNAIDTCKAVVDELAGSDEGLLRGSS